MTENQIFWIFLFWGGKNLLSVNCARLCSKSEIMLTLGDGNMHLNITSKTYNQEIMDKIEPYLYQWISENKGSIRCGPAMMS